ncbi:MAG: hypothetical protein WCI22_15135 [Actinomycetota bacterium]
MIVEAGTEGTDVGCAGNTGLEPEPVTADGPVCAGTGGNDLTGSPLTGAPELGGVDDVDTKLAARAIGAEATTTSPAITADNDNITATAWRARFIKLS